jgi:hypothetical protein
VRCVRSWGAAILLAVALGAAGGCGGSESSAPATVTAGGPATETSRAVLPPALIGTWTTTLKPADIPANAPPELADAAGQWRLEIAETGGPDNGPVLSIVHPEFGQLEGPSLEVEGDQLKLLQEECAASGEIEFFDNAYSYKLEADMLTITTVSNECADRVAETILTSRPWVRGE